MKITNRLPQFTHATALLIVTDHYHCTWYEAHRGLLNEMETFRLDKPHYSDREDFGRGASGIVYETGALFEKRHREAITEFLKEFKRVHHDRFATRRYDAIYLFAPADLLSIIRSILAPATSSLVEVAGTYIHEHPFSILERIAKQMKAPSIHATPKERRWSTAVQHS